MDESVVEGGVDVRNTEDKLALSNLGTERYGGFFLLSLLGGLHPVVSDAIQPKIQRIKASQAL